MPKKTKREKIIAQLRRQLQNSNSQIPTTLDIPKKTPMASAKPVFSTPVVKNTTDEIFNNNQYAYVFSDLKKILTVTLGLISLEGLLYYLLILKK